MASPRSSRGDCPPSRRTPLRSPKSPDIVARPVAHDWSDLFILGEADAEGEGSDPGAGGGAASAGSRGESRPSRAGSEGPRSERSGGGGLFRRLRDSMAKTRQALGSEIQATLFGVLDEQTWERLEEALIMADVGASTTASVVGTLEAEVAEKKIEGGEALSERLIGLLAETARVGDGRIDIRAKPTVILAVGVNGTGKTTTIGKLAWHLTHELGLSVLLAGADTFRAAAAEQLEAWAQRAGCQVVIGPAGSDPGAVAFEAIVQARS